MFDSQVVAFTLIAAVVTVIPGADTMLVVRNVLRGGRRDGIVTSLGICFGLFVHATMSAIGVSVILMHSATAFQAIKLAGAVYLVVLGVQSLSSAARRPAIVPVSPHAVAAAVVSLRRCFLEGMFSNLLNPKVVVFYLAFLPQFIGPTDAVLQKSLLLAAIHYLQGIVWLTGVSIGVDQMRRLFLRPVLRRWMDGVCGAVLVAFGARLALERQ